MASEPPAGGGGFGTFLIVWIGQLVSVLGSPPAGSIVDRRGTTVASAAGWLLPRIRNLEVEIPDGLEEVVG